MFNLSWLFLYLGPYSLTILKNIPLSHNNPCFQCNIAITNFLVLHMCEIIFDDVIVHSTTCVFLRKSSKTWLTYMAKWVCFLPLFFILICWIQLCEKNESDIRL